MWLPSAVSDSGCCDEAVEVGGGLDTDDEAVNDEEFDGELDADDEANGELPQRTQADAGMCAWAR